MSISGITLAIFDALVFKALGSDKHACSSQDLVVYAAAGPRLRDYFPLCCKVPGPTVMDSTEGETIMSDQEYKLLEMNQAVIESVERQTHRYGAMEDQQLDVYSPPPSPTSSPPPILVFFYGGGFTHGARTHPRQPLIHANFGAFFALKGILTVVAGYRLVPSVTFPEGSQDVRDALLWVSAHLKHIADSDRLFVVGHSAGGIHVAGFLLSPSSLASIPVRGVVLLGVAYEIPFGNKTASDLWAAAEIYYGGARNVAVNQPLGLLRRASRQLVASLPPLLSMIAAKEPRYISSACRNFAQLYERKGGVIRTRTLEGHGHLSPILSLASGQREEWGIQIAEWIFSQSPSS